MKKITLIISVILLIAAGSYLYLHTTKLKVLEPYVKPKLNDLIIKASDSLYHLTVEKFETDVTDSLVLINAHLYPDTAVYARLEKLHKAPNDLFDVTVHRLAVSELTPTAFAAGGTIDIGTLFIDNPVIKVLHKKQPHNVDGGDSGKTIYQQIQKDIRRIKIDTVLLNNVDFIYTNRNRQNKKTRILNMNLFFTDILVDSTTQLDRRRFFFTKTGRINLKNYALNTEDGLYQLSVRDIEIQTHMKDIHLSGLQFKPRLSKKDFYSRVKVSKDMYELAIGQVNLIDVDWWSSMAEESLLIHKAELKNGEITIYKNRLMPQEPGSKIGKYPHQLLMKAPLQMNIDSIKLNGINLAYTELNPKSGQEGTIRFSRINATVDHVTNMQEKIKKSAFCTIRASTLFMKKAPLKAEFVLDLFNARKGGFKVNMSLGAIGAPDLNSITVPLGLVKVNSVNIKSLDASIKGDNYSAAGTVKFLYNDLNITALKEGGDTLKKRKLLSFIANTFVIKKENPVPGKPVRVEQAGFQRDTEKSFFNLVWKTIFSGAGKTIGYKVKK